jgi:hypothetical protein
MGRSIEGNENNDGGAVIRDVIKAVIKWGEADEAHWPFKVSAVNKHPNVGAYHNAYDRRGTKKYYRIAAGDALAVRAAIAAGFAVVAGWQLNQSFEGYDGTETIPAQQAPFIGGHCMCIDEFYENGDFGLINSWGPGWGANGYARVTDGFVKQATDIWALEVT